MAASAQDWRWTRSAGLAEREVAHQAYDSSLTQPERVGPTSWPVFAHHRHVSGGAVTMRQPFPSHNAFAHSFAHRFEYPAQRGVANLRRAGGCAWLDCSGHPAVAHDGHCFGPGSRAGHGAGDLPRFFHGAYQYAGGAGVVCWGDGAGFDGLPVAEQCVDAHHHSGRHHHHHRRAGVFRHSSPFLAS